MKLSDFSVLTFDCYGTLIDWESGMIAGLKPLTDRMAARDGRQPDRNIILEAHARQENQHISARHRQSATAIFLPAFTGDLPRNGAFRSIGTKR